MGTVHLNVFAVGFGILGKENNGSMKTVSDEYE
jgi:hypothetical protein